MAITVDYIPTKDVDLATWCANFTKHVTENAVLWSIPPEEVSELQTLSNSFIELQAQADSPSRNAIIVTNKKGARVKLVAKIRKLSSFRLKNPVITDAQRIAMGLHVHKTKYTKMSAPPTRPEIEFEVRDIRRLAVVFRDQGSASKAKPYGVVGAMIAYAVLDTPPASPDALTNNVLATRTPCILGFTEMERGKTVYIVACWQNRKGVKGPWSNIEKTVVP
jgi:hypothetical protein